MKGQLSKYKWQVALFLVIGILVGYVAATGIVTVGLAKGGIPTNARECADTLDNDNDGDIDLADEGCKNKADNDESNCGDLACEGQEVCDVCVSDCGYCTYCGDGYCDGDETCSSCEADCGPCDTCTDTDGFNPSIRGTTSGYSEGESYSYTDACDGTIVMENYCKGTNPMSYPYECAGNVTTTCSNGACV